MRNTHKTNVYFLCKETKSLLKKHEPTGINTKKSDGTGNINTFTQYFPALKARLIRDWTGRTSGPDVSDRPSRGQVHMFRSDYVLLGTMG